MILKFTQNFLLIFLCVSSVHAQDSYKRNDNADVQHYRFDLALNDDSNEISGQTYITVNFEKVTDLFHRLKSLQSDFPDYQANQFQLDNAPLPKEWTLHRAP